MIRVKLKRTIYTEYETEVKQGGIKSERSANKRVVHFSSVVPVKPFSEGSTNEGIIKSESLAQVSKENNIDDSKRGMFFQVIKSYLYLKKNIKLCFLKLIALLCISFIIRKHKLCKPR